MTDAHLVLGHLPERLLDGSFLLDKAAATAAIAQRIAAPLGLGVEEAARSILDIINNTMQGAIRIVSVERGHEPKDFALVPLGGTGPLHGGALARLIGCPTKLILPTPGVLSALGLLESSLRAEFSRSCVQRRDHFDLDQIATLLHGLTNGARDWLAAEGVPETSCRLSWHASLLYEDQAAS